MRNKIILAITALFITGAAKAQLSAPARTGQFGFTQLMVNGWAQSSGMGNSNSSGVTGIESFHWNIAGLGKVNGTELAFSRSAWLVGTGININSFGFAQALAGDKGVIGMSVSSFSLGQIPITTYDQPDGGIGTYKPSISNINLGYAYNFGDKISAGINFKLASESTPDIRVGVFAIDAGLQYADLLTKKTVKYMNSDQNPAAGREADIRFGVSIKNLGTDAKYTGDGLAAKSNIDGKSYTQTTSQRADKTPLPSFLNVGVAYDFRLDREKDKYWHRLTSALSFTNNSAAPNQTAFGLEYAYREMLMLRAGYNYEKGILDYETRNNAYTGMNMGATVQLPIGKTSRIGVDYSYRSTNPFNGTHTFGLRIMIDSN
ncbi:MAG: PorV/PorQ family protein [Bacteroidia bacterium]|nr:PorV/PorQ family protein [Bacteroidia bacterium]